MSLTIFGISKSSFQRGRKKTPLLVRTFRGELSTVCSTHFENCSHIPSEETVIFVPCAETFFQVVAGETKLFMRASAAIFKTILQVVAGGSGVLVSDFRKNLSQW